jgi:hypothetical protein
MTSSIIIAIDSAESAEHVAAWLPVLVTARFRRVTLFHAVPEDADAIGEELDTLRPLLDRLAVALSAHAVETDIAFKRGDVVKWLIALAELRHSELLVVSLPGRQPEYVERLCAHATVPVLALPACRPRPGMRIDLDLPDPSMLVSVPAPSGSQLADLLGGSDCPILLYPSRAIGAPLSAN